MYQWSAVCAQSASCRPAALDFETCLMPSASVVTRGMRWLKDLLVVGEIAGLFADLYEFVAA